ncbi:beta-galactosidase [soil metagenome]
MMEIMVKRPWRASSWLGLLALALLAPGAYAQPPATEGRIAVPAGLKPGESVPLIGEWLYKPGYLVQAKERPELAGELEGYVRVPVPQLLNRTQWWLDDSEGFKAFEEARLARLGFDTERAEDGWYQLDVYVPVLSRGRHVFIEFDGVAMKSRAFLNGRLLGEHTGMFSRFAYDLTPYLTPGWNRLSVFVSMEKIPVSTLSLGQAVTVNLTASKILTLSKGMFGPLSPDASNRSYDLHGIWQPVKLVVRDAAMIDDAWFIPSVDGARVQVEVRSLAGTRPAVVRARWTEIGTNKVFAATDPLPLELGAEPMTRELRLRDVQPKLWTPADPNLYRLDVTLESASGVVLDRWTHNVGFRTFEVRGNRFFLNGKPYWLRGANQLPYGKNSWDPALPRRLIQLMHDGNQRVTRTHATPWNEAWLSAADEIGLGVSVEGIRPWALAGKVGATPADIFAHWLLENEDVVRRGRNHPSVLMWTIGNEMLLRDDENLEKWKQLSEVVTQTRRLDPFRPVVADSTYHRDQAFYDTVLKPNGLDDGDVDDIHRYRGWYSDSPFVIDTYADFKDLTPGRPWIGQEMSTGYPDLDTGLPVLRYTRDLLTPQAWVGQDAYPGSDPAVFLEHNRAVTKRWAEQLRYQRGERTAGFMLFSAECWFAHSYDAGRADPYPVHGAMRAAWAPVGLALETGRRRFHAREEIDTAVFVTNDDEQFRDLRDLTLRASFVDARTQKEVAAAADIPLADLPYYATVRVPVRIRVPALASGRADMELVLRLAGAEGEVTRSADRVEVFAEIRRAAAVPGARATAIGLGPQLRSAVANSGAFVQITEALPEGKEAARAVLLVGGDAALDRLREGGDLRAVVEGGATAILFSPGKALVDLFPQDVSAVRAVTGEYADLAPALGTALTTDLAALDVKWWGRKNDWRVFVATSAHRLKQGGRARELIRFIPAHSYIPAERVPEQYLSVLFEIPLGRGRVWVCDLDLEASAPVDPVAQILTANLLRAAADPLSTRNLPTVPSHAESLAGRHRQPVKANR